MELANKEPFQFLNIEKVKNSMQMMIKYNHNTRKRISANIIPELSEQNDTLVSLPVEDGEECTYYKAWQKRIKEQEYHRKLGEKFGKEYGVRKNGVLAFEVLCTVPKDKGIDIEEWKKRTMEWLHDTFDVASDGKSNILHAIYHGDEVGNCHIHALVVPIDERGRLNARRFTGGASEMARHQARYNEYIKDLGIRRGQAGSSAKHQKIRKLYSQLNKATQVDPPKELESATDYYKRIVDDVETYYASMYKKLSDRMADEQRKLDEIARVQREAIQGELEKTKKIEEHEKKVAKAKLDKVQEEYSSYQNQIEELQRQISQLEEQVRQERKRYKKYKEVNTKLEDAKKWQRLNEKVDMYSPRKVKVTKAIIEEVEEESEESNETNEQEKAIEVNEGIDW